jgi:hypothetical protein
MFDWPAHPETFAIVFESLPVPRHPSRNDDANDVFLSSQSVLLTPIILHSKF